MSEIIRNTFINIHKEPVMLIKGKTGYQTVIKKIVIINNTTKTSTVNVFIIDKDDDKYYLERNITIVSKSRLEIFNNKNFSLNRNDRVYIECIRESDIYVTCDYIKKMVNIKDIRLIFTDQHGINVEDINTSIKNSPFEINRKIISFEDNENYLSLDPVEYEINENKITIFKSNDISIISEFGIVDYNDKFVVTLFESTYRPLSDFSSNPIIKVNVVQDSARWKYISITEGVSGSTSDWLLQDEEYVITPGDYEIEFEKIDEFDPPGNFSFTALENNIYEFSFDYDFLISGETEVSILKSDFMDEYDALGVRWKINGYENILNYNDTFSDLGEGIYTIEVKELEEYFDSFTDSIAVYENHKTIYKINNDLSRQNILLLKSFLPERITIAINVIKKPVLSLTVEPSGIDNANWRLIYPTGVKTEWKTQYEEIKTGTERYQLEFSNVDNYVTPSIYDIIIPLKIKKLKIKCIYTEMQVYNLNIVFRIPNKYVQYLQWCLLSTSDIEEVFIVSWNNSTTYDEILPKGKYQIKIKEVIFGETIENPVYTFTTGEIIPTKCFIESQTININLIEDTVIDKKLITNLE